MRITNWALVTGFVVAGCGSAADDPDGGNETDASAADAADRSTDAGGEPPGYRVDLSGVITITEGDASGQLGTLYAYLHSAPEARPLVEVVREGECAIYKRGEPGFCEPPCSDGFCNAQDVCVPSPVNRSAGTIVATGLIGDLTFTHGDFGYVASTEMTGNYFDSGSAIRVSAPGDEVPGFVLEAVGVSTLSTELHTIELHDDQDEVVTWEAESSGRIQVALALGWHGTPATDLLLCETADDGSLTIPRSLIQQFPYFEVGLAQVPLTLARFDRAVASVDGKHVELFAASVKSIAFSHLFP